MSAEPEPRTGLAYFTRNWFGIGKKRGPLGPPPSFGSAFLTLFLMFSFYCSFFGFWITLVSGDTLSFPAVVRNGVVFAVLMTALGVASLIMNRRDWRRSTSDQTP